MCVFPVSLWITKLQDFFYKNIDYASLIPWYVWQLNQKNKKYHYWLWVHGIQGILRNSITGAWYIFSRFFQLAIFSYITSIFLARSSFVHNGMFSICIIPIQLLNFAVLFSVILNWQLFFIIIVVSCNMNCSVFNMFSNIILSILSIPLLLFVQIQCNWLKHQSPRITSKFPPQKMKHFDNLSRNKKN